VLSDAGFNRRAGKVRCLCPKAAQPVEEGRLAGVRIPQQREIYEEFVASVTRIPDVGDTLGHAARVFLGCGQVFEVWDFRHNARPP
jgi:hypothetical protein